MNDRNVHIIERLRIAELAEAALHRYLHLLHATETEAEIHQLQRLLGDWRSAWPKPKPWDE